MTNLDTPWTQIAVSETLSCLSGSPENLSSEMIDVNVLGEIEIAPSEKLVVIAVQQSPALKTIPRIFFSAVVVTEDSNRQEWKVTRTNYVSGKGFQKQGGFAAFLDTPLARIITGITRSANAKSLKISVGGKEISEQIVEFGFIAQLKNLLPPLSITLLDVEDKVIDFVNIP